MGSRKRQEAIANGKIVETAESRRRRVRAEATFMREQLAIELYAKGSTVTQIEEAMFAAFGVRLHGNILALVRRAVYRRAQENKADVELAKQMMLEHFRPLIETYMPRALGELDDPDSPGQKLPPDTRAAELVLKVLDKVGQVTGAMAPPRAGDVNLHLQLGQAPPDADTARRQAAEAIAREAAKLREIEGQLVGTPAVEGSDAEAVDAPPPYEFDLPATPA